MDLADVARALHMEFDLGPGDMSIRPFYPQDFLILCKSKAIRDLLVARGHAGVPRFDLSLRPWLRQEQATAIVMPFLVQLRLVGVPANAWTLRTAESVLRDLGMVVKVAGSTARRDDMAGFRVWLRTDDPARIPPRRILVLEEPRRRDEGVDALWYPVDIVQEEPPVLVSEGSLSQPPPPPPPADDDDED